MSSSQRTGQIIVCIIIAVTLLIDLALLALKAQANRPAGGDIGRLGLTLVLFYCLWAGQAWARWVTVVLFGLGGVFAVGAGVALPALPLLLLGACYLGSAVCLAFLPPVKEFMDYQQGKAS